MELCRRLRGDQVRVVAGVRAGSDRSELDALGVECREVDALQPEQLLNAMREHGELVYRTVDSEQAFGKTYTAADRRHAKILGGGEVVPAQL